MAMSAQTIDRIEPLSWWTEMELPLTVMIHGSELNDAQVSIQKKVGKKLQATEGLRVKGQHNAESKNYLFVDLEVREVGEYVITLKKGKKTAKVNYTIGERRAGSKMRRSFTTADVVYLLMPDRFVDGDESNNSHAATLEKGDKANIHGRHGGDIQGIIQSLDYIKSLGATAIWPTPLTLDNEPSWSYHGYACADYYHIDPRFGSNELYKEMVKQAHAKGLKFIMDMVPNHCGLAHWWMNDLPYKDWVHQFENYTQTNNAFTTAYDVNASAYDRYINESGWFDTHMPDMNLDNKDLLHYFKQWAIWWIEYADLDGLRVDTYPYNEKQPAAEWCRAIRKEYPNINIVGECWTRPASEVAYWQADHMNQDGFNSNLPSVMDFPTEEAIRAALADAGEGWGNGLTKVYDAITQDYHYANLNHLFTFIGNHDMEHIADVVNKNDLRRVELAITLLATMRGIPQIFAGDEYGQRSADMSMGHSGLRCMLRKPETREEKALLAYQMKLFNWRKGNEIIHKGKTMHFISRDNTYCFFRYTDKGCVMVFANAAEEEREIPIDHYKEILDIYGYQGFNIVDGTKVKLEKGMKIKGLNTIVIELGR